MNSAVDNPSHPTLKALPLDLVKYLEIVVVAVWDIIPWPENLIKKIAINNKVIEETFEKKKDEKNKRQKKTGHVDDRDAIDDIFGFWNMCS